MLLCVCTHTCTEHTQVPLNSLNYRVANPPLLRDPDSGAELLVWLHHLKASFRVVYTM